MHVSFFHIVTGMVQRSDRPAHRIPPAQLVHAGRHYRAGHDRAGPSEADRCHQHLGHRYLRQHRAQLVPADPVCHLHTAGLQRNVRNTGPLVAHDGFLRFHPLHRHRVVVCDIVSTVVSDTDEKTFVPRQEARQAQHFNPETVGGNNYPHPHILLYPSL